MNSDKEWQRLAHWFARKYPTALRDLVADLVALPATDPRREDRDQCFVRYLRARGERNVTAITVNRRISRLLSRPSDLGSLLTETHAGTLVDLCQLWLAGSSSQPTDVGEMTANACTPTAIPTPEDVEAGRFRALGYAPVNKRAAVLALICTQRLRSDSPPRRMHPPGPVLREGPPPFTSAEQDHTDPRGPALFQSSTLNRMTETLHALPPDDPTWDELDAWLESVRSLAADVTSARSVLQTRERVLGLLERWSGEHGARTRRLGHEVPTCTQVPTDAASLATLEPVVAGALDALQRAASLEERLRADVNSMFELADEIASVKQAAIAALDIVCEFLGGKAGPEANAPPPDAPPTQQTEALLPEPPVVRPVAVRVTPPVSPEALRSHRTPAGRVHDDVLLCLDFGTARSKAMGVAADESPRFLDIGVVTRSKLERSIASSVWIDSGEGRMYFGDTATERSLVAGNRRQLCIDSLKDFLSASRAINGLLPDPDGRQLDHRYNPTAVNFSLGEVLVLYLGYMSWATEEGARKLGIRNCVRRRFAIPSWEVAERKAGITLLRRYLARAVLVGRHVGAAWLDGIPLKEAHDLARTALDLVDDDLPLDLLAEGVTEPLAAVGTREDELALRNGLVLVVDVGAGTTDFGLYLVIAKEGDRARFIEVATHSINRAGNHLDNALSNYVLRDFFGDRQDPAREGASIELQQRQRSWKEDLFMRRQVRVQLQAGYNKLVDLDGFRREKEVVEFERAMRQGFEEVFARAEREVAKNGEGINWSRYPKVRVVLTGGGAMLPMVREIASQAIQLYRNPGFEREQCTVSCEVSTQLPQRVRNSGVDEAGYLPLAVAWGGAMPELPVQGKPVGLATVRPPDSAPSVASALIPPAESWMRPK